jgi:hypothetical protein
MLVNVDALSPHSSRVDVLFQVDGPLLRIGPHRLAGHHAGCALWLQSYTGY